MYGASDESHFEYGIDGERVEKRTGSGRIARYFGPEFERVYEKGLWHDELYVTVGGERLAYVSTAPAVQGKVFYLHPDVQGTIGVVTDESGAVAKYTLYTPFGETYEELTAVKVDLRYGYTGGEHDEEVGLVHLGVREHEPRYARFLQPDPITPDVHDPTGLNPYAYALYNPVRYTDPSGYEPGDRAADASAAMAGGSGLEFTEALDGAEEFRKEYFAAVYQPPVVADALEAAVASKAALEKAQAGDTPGAIIEGCKALKHASHALLQAAGIGAVGRVATVAGDVAAVGRVAEAVEGEEAAVGGASEGQPPQVTEATIREAMRDAPLASQQRGGVSLPRVQQYVDRLVEGEIAPAIKVDGRMIVDGNHRYIAGRIVGREPAIQPWSGARPEQVISWDDIPISPEFW